MLGKSTRCTGPNECSWKLLKQLVETERVSGRCTMIEVYLAIRFETMVFGA